jgi:Ca2+:H+ antiporter
MAIASTCTLPSYAGRQFDFPTRNRWFWQTSAVPEQETRVTTHTEKLPIHTEKLPLLSGKDRVMIALTAISAVVAGVLNYANANELLSFVASAIALATLASLVGRSVEALGDRLGPSATGILQSALGNLPELFVILFALKAGLFEVVKATLVGSILANVLLVLGLAFVVGGVKHGRQRFAAEAGKALGLMLTLAVFILAVPSLTAALHTPAESHERAVSIVVSFVMLGLFALSLIATLTRGKSGHEPHEGHSAEGSSPIAASPDSAKAASTAVKHGEWPLAMAIGMLAITGLGAAFVSEWFVAALEPAMESVGINEVFAGLVIVAIAGNAVENVVGIQLAAKNQMDYGVQVILQSPVQVALTVAPIVCLAAGFLGQPGFDLVLSPLLLAAMMMSALVAVLVTFDGESNWFEGAVLIALYIAIATAFWWG